MKIGIVGLGLIGGSLAKAIKIKTKYKVYGHDLDNQVIKMALEDGVLDGYLLDHLTCCEFILIALYPDACQQFLKKNGAKIAQKTIVIDCCGIKKDICDFGERIAQQYGFIFIGGHPMEGIELSGYENSYADLFQKASMILIPSTDEARQVLEDLKVFFLQLGFREIRITTAKRHDKLIAYTSQLAHIVSSAYIKSPSAFDYQGFSAGSFKDMTRIAYLNEDMWSQLLMHNKDYLLPELDLFIANIQAYRDALSANNQQELKELLLKGKQIKSLLT